MKRLGLLAFAMVIGAGLVFTGLQAGDKDKKAKTVTGTLVDLACYAKGGFLTNDHGDMKNCGTMCASGGIPVAVVDSDKKVHVLAAPAPGYAQYVGQEVRLTGGHGKHADVFIPQKFEVKSNGKWVEKDLPKTMM